jgi:CDP-glucose 4,6-dehydratase
MALTAGVRNSYRGRRVLVTGHTGFKGSWLASWLTSLDAEVFGYALPPPQGLVTVYDTAPKVAKEVLADIRERDTLIRSFRDWCPNIVFHLAAQPLVRASYEDPERTFGTNVMGVVNVLEAAREISKVQAVIVITSDKCYDNCEWCWPYRECDPLGGADPYSASKACAEIVTAAYRRSFLSEAGCAVASARAGNVMGGGDWSKDRLVPDLARSFSAGIPACIRNPQAVRPFQHVLDALGGYLLLGHRLLEDAMFADCYNFGPLPGTELTVEEVARKFACAWAEGELRGTPEPDARHEACVLPLDLREAPEPDARHEACVLRLDSSKAMQRLGWTPLLSSDEMIEQTVAWYRAATKSGADLAGLTLQQIDLYSRRAAAFQA